MRYLDANIKIMTEGKRHRKKRIPSLPVFAVVAAASLLFAGGSPESSEFGGTAVIAIPTLPQGFNPLIDRGDVTGNWVQLMFNSLVKLNEQLKATPDLAERWEVSADRLVWTFPLKQGILFHDGTEFTSADVVFTLNAIRNPERPTQLTQLFAVIDKIEAPNKYSVEITLKSPFTPILYLLSTEILPAHMFGDSSNAMEEFRRNPVGTGPFIISEWKESEIVLSANNNYFEGRPYLDTVILRSVPAKREAWSALMQSKIDFVGDLEKEDYDEINEHDQFTVYSYLDVFYNAILFNLEDELFSDPRIRRAINMAIDRADILEETLNDRAQETTGPFIPGTLAYNSDVKSQVYDPEGAVELLGEVGWNNTDNDPALENDGKELEFSLVVDKGDLVKTAVAQRIKWQLYQIGIKVNVELLEFQQLLNERMFPGRFQTALFQFNAAGDPDTFLYLFWHSRQIGASNLAKYRNQDVDRLIEEGRTEPDQDKRATIYQQIHKSMAEENPAIFLFVREIFIGTASRIEGIVPSPHIFYQSAKDWKLAGESF